MTPEQLRHEITEDDATLQEIQRIASRYQRHTIDISGPAPQFIEADMLALEKGWRRAKLAWVVLGVLVVGFVVWRWMNGGGE